MKKLPTQNFFRLRCLFCKSIFIICSSCYRGHIYCCSTCKVNSRKKSRRKSSKKYQASAQGNKNHRFRQNRYRRLKKRKKTKEVTHQSSLITPKDVKQSTQSFEFNQNNLIDKTSNCCVCGRKAVLISYIDTGNVCRKEKFSDH